MEYDQNNVDSIIKDLKRAGGDKLLKRLYETLREDIEPDGHTPTLPPDREGDVPKSARGLQQPFIKRKWDEYHAQQQAKRNLPDGAIPLPNGAYIDTHTHRVFFSKWWKRS